MVLDGDEDEEEEEEDEGEDEEDVMLQAALAMSRGEEPVARAPRARPRRAARGGGVEQSAAALQAYPAP